VIQTLAEAVNLIHLQEYAFLIMHPSLTTTPATDIVDANQLSQSLASAYQSLGEGDSSKVAALYAEDIYFEDPTQGIQGKTALMKYIDSTFLNIGKFSFKSHKTLASDTDMFISWTQIFTHKKLAGGKTIRVEGSTYLKTRNGKIYYQRDYFDLGAVVYENLPIIGAVIKRLRSRLK
jgi:ketosteroid isomerase-like protein|tara:strand:- start:330 stop:860 length:531 start_codon:yes stop_codon:yes gene_type:complete